jgi:hypothetical protein
MPESFATAAHCEQEAIAALELTPFEAVAFALCQGQPGQGLPDKTD